VSNELTSTLTTGAPSRRWVAAMAATALAAVAALALSIAAILSAGPPAVVGPKYATPTPLVRVTPAQGAPSRQVVGLCGEGTNPRSDSEVPAGVGEVKSPAPWWWVVSTAVVGVGGMWLVAHPHGQAAAVGVVAVPVGLAVMLGLWRVEVEVRKEDE